MIWWSFQCLVTGASHTLHKFHIRKVSLPTFISYVFFVWYGGVKEVKSISTRLVAVNWCGFRYSLASILLRIIKKYFWQSTLATSSVNISFPGYNSRQAKRCLQERSGWLPILLPRVWRHRSVTQWPTLKKPPPRASKWKKAVKEKRVTPEPSRVRFKTLRAISQWPQWEVTPRVVVTRCKNRATLRCWWGRNGQQSLTWGGLHQVSQLYPISKLITLEVWGTTLRITHNVLSKESLRCNSFSLNSQPFCLIWKRLREARYEMSMYIKN